MKVTREKPEIITLLYRQEKTDEDYGSCLWARFYFDLKNYTLSIESDCGNYAYSWVPMPDSEPFLELCARFRRDYLLSKISSESVISRKATCQAIKDLVEDIIKMEEMENLSDYDWKEIESACYIYDDERDTAEAIISALNDTELYGKFEEYDIWGAIEKDYPNNAKKITSIFATCIQPFIKKMEGE